MQAGSSFGTKMKEWKISKIPTWVWWIILYVLSVGSNYFIMDTSINQLAMVSSSINVGAEKSNMLWVHFVSGLFSVFIFELVANLYASLVLNTGRFTGGFDFTKRDFVTIFRLFYFPVLIVSGVLQILYYYITISVVFGTAFFALIPRIFMMIAFSFFMKKNFLTEYNTHTFLRAFFVPYFIYEIISIAWIFVL